MHSLFFNLYLIMQFFSRNSDMKYDKSFISKMLDSYILGLGYAYTIFALIILIFIIAYILYNIYDIFLQYNRKIN